MFPSLSRRGTVVRTALVLALPALASSCVLAQVLYGTLTGNVTDAQNAAVAGATVTIKSDQTGFTRTASTDSSGNYSIPDVPQGTYTVTVTGTGFGTATSKNIAVAVNQTRRVDAALTVGGATESIDVNTAPPALQTDRADVNYEITATQVAQLPTTGTAGRNFQGLYRLIPGVPPPLEKNSQAGNPGRAQAVNANGVAQTINSTKIDGASVGYPWLQSLVAYIPPQDSIESANIVTNSFNAEQGAAGGIAANLIVKSGTNHFHGGAWEYNSISQFNARSYFLRPTAAQPNAPKNIYNEYGANLGGPIVKDKLFFFFNYNKVSIRRLVNGGNTFSTPLAAFRNGDFSSILNGTVGNTALGNYTAAQTAIYDPATGNANGTGRTQFAGNIIPVSRLSAPAVRLMSDIPLPTLNQISANYVGGATLQYDRGSYDTKVSYNPTDRTTFFGRYSVQRSLIIDPPALGSNVAKGTNSGAVGNTWDGGQPGTAPGTIQNVGLGATHTFTPNFLIDANAGFVRINLAAQAPDVGTNYGLNYLGIPGTNGSTAFESGLPGFILNNSLASVGNYLQSNPFQFRDMQYVGNLNGTWIKGNHTMRFGGEYVHSAINHLQANNNGARGQFTFSGGITGHAPNATGDTTGNPNFYRSIADFLLGLPQAPQKTVQVFKPNGPRFSVFGFFAQDTWKASSNLTINYGIRYEYYPFANRDHTGVFRFDPATSNVLIGGRGNTPTDTGEQIGYGQFVPRLGINYRIDDKTVIRSGFGLTVDPENYRFFRDSYPALINFSAPGANNYLPGGSLSATNQTAAPYGTLTVGIPTIPIPDISSGVVPLPYNYATQTAPQRWRRGYVETWNLFVDRDLARGMVLTVGYVGTHHVRQVLGVDINAAGVNAVGNAARPLKTNANAPGNINGLPTTFTNTLTNVLPAGDEEYSGLQAQFTDRQMKSFQFGYAYTYSHSLNYYDLDSTLGTATFSTAALYKRNYGNSQYDRTHINALWTVWNVPIGPGRQYLNTGLLGRLVGGFDLNTITTYDSGVPFQITDGRYNGYGDTSVPNQVKALALTGTRYTSASSVNPYYFVNNGTFVPGTGTVNGNVGRNTVRGPGYFNLDVALSRNIPIWRELNVNLKAESFDITNTPQWSTPVSDLNNSGFGQIQTVINNSNRVLRLSGRISF